MASDEEIAMVLQWRDSGVPPTVWSFMQQDRENAGLQPPPLTQAQQRAWAVAGAAGGSEHTPEGALRPGSADSSGAFNMAAFNAFNERRASQGRNPMPARMTEPADIARQLLYNGIPMVGHFASPGSMMMMLRIKEPTLRSFGLLGCKGEEALVSFNTVQRE